MDPTAPPPHVTALAFSPGGVYVAAATASNHLHLFNTRTGTLSAWSQAYGAQVRFRRCRFSLPATWDTWGKGAR